MGGSEAEKQKTENKAVTKANKMGGKPAFFNRIILNSEMKPVAFFVLLITIFSIISTLFAAYFSCFGEPVLPFVVILDNIIEICFALDIVRNFFMQFTDPSEPRKPIRDFLRIAKHYVTGSFIFDFTATIATPLLWVLKDKLSSNEIRLIYLLRLLRISKIFILMNLQKFTELIRNYFRRRLKNSIKINYDQEDLKVDNNKIMQQIFLIKFF